MPMNLPVVIFKFVVISVIAALTACVGLVLAGLVIEGADVMASQGFEALFGAVSMALLGTFTIGLPISLLLYVMAGKHIRRFPSSLILITALCGTMMLIASAVIGDAYAIALLGLPSFVAAITYAVMGWFWIIKPQRDAETFDQLNNELKPPQG